jgi:HAE1 family hydrophobic/amphiphilic exporter-1
MSIAGFCVKRPVLTTMVTLIVVVFGFASFTRLPIDLLPELTYPTLTVSTSYGNASPEEMETLITQHIEEAVAAVPGVEDITSTSAEGSSSVRVTFTWGTDLDVAANDIRDRVDRVIRNLPDDADRPQIRKFDVAAFPVVILGVSSDLDPLELRQFIDDQISYRFERTPGVAAADVWGGLEREIQVNLDLEKIKALGIPFNEVLQRIQSENVNVPAGTIERGNHDVTLRVPGEYESVDELRSIVLFTRDGAPVYLHQVAGIVDTHAKIRQIVRINGKPGVRLAIRKQSGSNTVEVADAVLEEVERLNREFPQLSIKPVIDTSLYIRRSIDNVMNSVLVGGLLAIAILFIFLRSLRSTFIISTAIPISIIASFALIYFFGYTLNLMTLGGLALGVGMMVDNAIVVLENIYRVRRDEPNPAMASVMGTNEVAAAIIASTVTTLVIFIPMFFSEGVSGVLYGQLAVVIAFSLICSLAVALTLIPMLASRILRPGDTGHASNPVLRVLERMFEAVEETYGDLLKLALRWRVLVALAIVGMCGASLLLIPYIGTEFLPASDEGEVRVNAEMEVGTRLEVLDEQMQKIEAIVAKAIPETVNSVASLGSSSWRPSGGTEGSIQVAVGTQSTRQRSSVQIATDVRMAIGDIPGVTIRTRASEGLRILRLGSGSDDSLEIEVRGFEFEILEALAAEVERHLLDVDGITDVRISRESGVPQELIRPDRERAADLGLTTAEVARALETAIAGSRAGYYREHGNEYRILVKLRDAEKLDLEQVLDLTLTNSRGEQVALRNVVNIEPRSGPQIVERKNQERVAYITANVEGRDLGSVIEDVRNRLDTIPRPGSYAVLIAGDYEEQQEAFRDLLISLAVAIVLVFMVLASLYEGFRDPIIVMFSVPLAAVGVLVMLFLTDTTFNTQTFIGCIMLGGIVVNNAILIVDQATQLRRDKAMSAKAAATEAATRRLRPILMTSLTTVLGLLPLALGIGEGADAQAPLARAVIGGLLSSTLITLIFIPIVYTIFYGRGAESRVTAGAVVEAEQAQV